MKIEKELMDSLNKNRVRNINLINFINSYPINRVEKFGDSLFVQGLSDQDWVYINSESEEEARGLLNKLSGDEKYFFIQEDFLVPLLKERSEIDWILACRKLYYPDEIELCDTKVNIRVLSKDEAEYIYRNYDYKMYTSVDYIRDRIANGIAIGIEEEDKLVAWIITQDDGAMGFLTVLPDYRRKGYGYELTTAMIKRVRAAGDLPFVHIEETNEKSMFLAMKMGYVKDSLVQWIKLK